MKTASKSGLKILWTACLAGVLFTSRPAGALSFTPTDSEWLAWPDYCRARYVVSGAGLASSLANAVTAEEVARHQSAIGEEAWHYLHHYCAALAYLDRALAETDKKEADFWLAEAEANFMGQYERISRANHMFPDTVIGIAQVHRERQQYDIGLRFLAEAMEAQPHASSPYALAAIIWKERGDLQRATDVLLRGNEAVEGKSAELHYFLGLMYIDRGNLDSAAEHAKLAYDLGYPLPGLASKLRRLGHPLR